MIKDSDVLVLLLGNTNSLRNFQAALNQSIPDSELHLIQQPTCIGRSVYPAVTIGDLLRYLESCELQYVAILQGSYVSNISSIHTVMGKYEVECSGEKRIMTRRVPVKDVQPDYEPTDDFDLGHDFVFGKRVDVLAILQDKQSGKYSASNHM